MGCIPLIYAAVFDEETFVDVICQNDPRMKNK
jgi:hypothetical protein